MIVHDILDINGLVSGILRAYLQLKFHGFHPQFERGFCFFLPGIESRNPNMATPGSTLWISMDLRVLWAWEQWIVRGRISNGRIWTHRGFINYTSMLGSSARNMAFASRTFHLCWPAKNQRKRCRTAASAPEMMWNNASEANEWLHIWRLIASFSQLVLESFLDDFDLVQYMGLSENSVPLHPMVNDHYPY